MKKLSNESFERARKFLLQHARPLERSLFLHRFEGAGTDGVLIALSSYQNLDGGFGRALEPDMRSPSSSSLATAIGLRILVELGSPAEEPIVRRAVSYLEGTFEKEMGVWRPVPLDVNSYPHAPWWHDGGGSLERIFDGFRIIPRALVVAGLCHHSSLVSADWLNDVTERTIESIESDPELGGGGGSDLEYAIALAETEGLPSPWERRLRRRLLEAIPKAVVADPERWGSYCLTPLRVISTPETIGADLVSDLVQRHLDYQIDHQSAEGTWDPAWSWGDAYPEAWAQARLEWRGHLALESLTRLKAFGRIED
jgi:hypothetical protein